MKLRLPPFSGAVRLLLTAACLSSFLVQSAVGARADGSTSLGSLETMVPSSPALQADQLAIQAAADGVRETRDKIGVEYSYANNIGPAAVIVPFNVDEHVLRFEQVIGAKLPILGSRVDQQLELLDAEKTQQLALIAMDDAFRSHLDDLRQAYVNYWTDEKQVATEQAYLNGAHQERPQANALVTSGFWTQTNYLDYINTINTVSSQLSEDRDSATAELAVMAAAVGRPVTAFDPADPAFFAGCTVDRNAAVTSAHAVDTTLAELEAERVTVENELARVKGSSVQASVDARAGSQTDINQQVSGYDLNVGLSFALTGHARDEEHALRAKYQTQLQMIALEEQQRKVEIDSSIDAYMAQLTTENEEVAQALALQHTHEQDLRNASARANSLKEAPQLAFTDIHSKLDDLYASRRAVISAQSDVLLKASALLKVAPSACGAAYTAIPPFVPVLKSLKAASRKNKGRSPSPKKSPAGSNQ